MITKIIENCILQPKMKSMFKVKYIIAFFFFTLLACSPDDDGTNLIAERDRGEEAIAGQLEIELFLETNTYNYEDFANPPADFDFKIVFSPLTGENSDKTPLIDFVDSKIVVDRFEEDVTYRLYFLVARQGLGDSPDFPDIAVVNFEGTDLDGVTFDASVVPIAFDLTTVVNGFQDIAEEFNASSSFETNADGTISFEDFGVGAMFIPSGLGFFASPPFNSGLNQYEQIVFTFQMLETIQGDQDNDGIPSIFEDIDDNGQEENDDSDDDLIPNFSDSDDDNDGVPTREEILDSNGNLITDPALYPDVDNDGTPDYLDSDS